MGANLSIPNTTTTVDKSVIDKINNIESQQQITKLQLKQLKETVNNNFELIGKIAPLIPENFISNY